MNHRFKETLKNNAYWIRFMLDIYANIEDEIVTNIQQIEAEINRKYRCVRVRQTAKAPVYLRILGGFPIYVDGSVDGFRVQPRYNI